MVFFVKEWNASGKTVKEFAEFSKYFPELHLCNSRKYPKFPLFSVISQDYNFTEKVGQSLF